jgi:hypothetical protein
MLEDKAGNFWFGTNGDGVIRYNGKSLEYFSIEEGFGGVAVRGIVQDKNDAIWFATDNGLIKYDGEKFTTLTKKDGLAHDDIWSIVLDRNGALWIGTFGGVSRFNGTAFTPFDLPEAPDDPNRGVSSPRMVYSIMQDSKGRMWFGTNGGAYVYDGKGLTNISKDGLCSNAVNSILEDQSAASGCHAPQRVVARWENIHAFLQGRRHPQHRSVESLSGSKATSGSVETTAYAATTADVQELPRSAGLTQRRSMRLPGSQGPHLVWRLARPVPPRRRTRHRNWRGQAVEASEGSTRAAAAPRTRSLGNWCS